MKLELESEKGKGMARYLEGRSSSPNEVLLGIWKVWPLSLEQQNFIEEFREKEYDESGVGVTRLNCVWRRDAYWQDSSVETRFQQIGQSGSSHCSSPARADGMQNGGDDCVDIGKPVDSGDI